MPSSAFFSKNDSHRTWITLQPSKQAERLSVRFARFLLPVLLLAGIAAFSQGCAANKCDCPKFGGHRVSH